MTEFLIAGMAKNQKLAANILTPTTKAADHDVPITPEEVFSILSEIPFFL
jgi:phosphoribosylaminoimidazole-succinocarboxamide synthase